MQEILTAAPSLTPREQRLERAGARLQLAAILNAILAAGLVVVGVVVALIADPQAFSVLKSGLLFRYPNANDTALLVTILLLLINTSVLLVTMVGVLAQEFWAFLTTAILFIGNLALLILFGFTLAILTLLALLWGLIVLIPDLRAFRLNPVMLKELRERMRGARAFAVITVYLGLMTAFTVLLYVAYSPLNNGFVASVTGELGRVLFAAVVGIEMILIIFIAPAFTAGAVTGERERKTYDLLQITLLPRPSFIIGKLESALGYIFLLLLAAIPLQSIAFLFGGVSETELLISFVILVVTAITLGTVGLFFSTLTERTLTASVRSYTFAFAFIFGFPIALSILLGIVQGLLYDTGGTFRGAPAVEALLIYLQQFVISLNPITAGLGTQTLLINQQTLGFWSQTLSSNGGSIPVASPWISFTILYLVISAVLITLSIRQIRRTEL